MKVYWLCTSGQGSKVILSKLLLAGPIMLTHGASHGHPLLLSISPHYSQCMNHSLIAVLNKDNVSVVHISTSLQSDCLQATAGRTILVNTHMEHLMAPPVAQHFPTLQPIACTPPSLLFIINMMY